MPIHDLEPGWIIHDLELGCETWATWGAQQDQQLPRKQASDIVDCISTIGWCEPPSPCCDPLLI